MINNIGVSSSRVGNFNIVVTVTGNGPVDLSLTALESTTLRVKGLKKDESEGTFTKPPVWTVDNPSIVVITPAADGLACSVSAAQPPQVGTAVVTVTDSDDPSVPPVTINITIAGDPITHMRVDIDPPSVKTPA